VHWYHSCPLLSAGFLSLSGGGLWQSWWRMGARCDRGGRTLYLVLFFVLVIQRSVAGLKLVNCAEVFVCASRHDCSVRITSLAPSTLALSDPLLVLSTFS
jgi:hypothetical protein